MVLSKKDQSTICRAYKSGKSVQSLSDKYGVSKQRIYVILHKNGIYSEEWSEKRAQSKETVKADKPVKKDKPAVKAKTKTDAPAKAKAEVKKDNPAKKDKVVVKTDKKDDTPFKTKVRDLFEEPVREKDVPVKRNKPVKKDKIKDKPVKEKTKAEVTAKAKAEAEVKKVKVPKPKVADTVKSEVKTEEQRTVLTSILIADGSVQTITTTDKAYASEIELRWRAVPNIRTHAFGDPNGKTYTVVYYFDDEVSEKVQDNKVFESNLDVIGMDEDFGFYVKVPIPKELAEDVNDAVIDGRAKVKVVWE